MFVHTPKNMRDEGNIAIIKAHGGRAIGGSAKLSQNKCCYIATKFNAAVFNPSYRLAGSMTGDKLSTVDHMATDIIAVIKHVVANAQRYKVDPNKIILMGNSGGGYAISTACGKLVQNGEPHLVKLVIPICYTTPGYYFVKKK